MKGYEKWPKTALQYFWSLQEILLGIVRELAGGGSMAVTVDVNDIQQMNVKCNT